MLVLLPALARPKPAAILLPLHKGPGQKPLPHLRGPWALTRSQAASSVQEEIHNKHAWYKGCLGRAGIPDSHLQYHVCDGFMILL